MAPRVRRKCRASSYREYAVDGMPACRFCKVRFTRVEGLKKHIRRGCPKLGCPHPSPEEEQQGVVTAPEVQVASGQGELNRQTALQITPEDPAEQPLIHDLTFRTSLQISWRQPLRDPAFRKKMSTYCVLCGKWISNVGPACALCMLLSGRTHRPPWLESPAWDLIRPAPALTAASKPRTFVSICAVVSQCSSPHLQLWL